MCRHRSFGRANFEHYEISNFARDVLTIADNSSMVATALLPIAHGEGRFVASSADLRSRLESDGQVAVRWTDAGVIP